MSDYSWGLPALGRNGDGKPVVALDLDGTLGDYHANFLEFACRYFDNADFRNLIGVDNPGLPLWQFMGIPHREYRDAKLAYRQGGWKRWMPAYPMAAQLTSEIRLAGAEVWLCTTRPYLRLDNVDPDTREWLRRNRIQYDALLFDPAHEEDGTKYDELKRQAGERVCAILDDLPEMIEAADRAFPYTQVRPIIRDQPYNRHMEPPQGIQRAGDLTEAWHLIKADIAVWKDLHHG